MLKADASPFPSFVFVVNGCEKFVNVIDAILLSPPFPRSSDLIQWFGD
jgi:hypothetical protein